MTGTVAVTGASGFVGSHTCRALTERGWHVIGFGRRPRPLGLPAQVDYRRWDLAAGPLPEPPAVDVVVHAAATVDDRARWRDQLPGTVTGTAHVLATWPGVRVVHVSSASVYPAWATGTLTEADGPATRFTSPYARAKAVAEHLLTRETARTGRSVAVLRPHAVHGPGDPTLLPRLVAAVRGPGRGLLAVPARRGGTIHLTSVHTLAHVITLACAHPITGPVNVADAEPVDLLDTIAAAVARVRGAVPRLVRVDPVAARALATVVEPGAALAGRHPTLTRYLVGHLGYATTYDLTRLRTELGHHPGPTRIRWAEEPC